MLQPTLEILFAAGLRLLFGRDPRVPCSVGAQMKVRHVDRVRVRLVLGIVLGRFDRFPYRFGASRKRNEIYASFNAFMGSEAAGHNPDRT